VLPLFTNTAQIVFAEVPREQRKNSSYFCHGQLPGVHSMFGLFLPQKGERERERKREREKERAVGWLCLSMTMFVFQIDHQKGWTCFGCGFWFVTTTVSTWRKPGLEWPILVNELRTTYKSCVTWFWYKQKSASIMAPRCIRNKPPLLTQKRSCVFNSIQVISTQGGLVHTWHTLRVLSSGAQRYCTSMKSLLSLPVELWAA